MKQKRAGGPAAILVAALALLWGTSVSAQTTGTLTLDSPPGDWVGDGQFWQYDSTNATYSTSSDGSLITVNTYPTSGGWWTVQLAAPPGQTLAVGSYEGAVRAVFRPAGSPGIDVYGMGRGCNTTAGRFDVTEVTFGPNNYVQSFSATFEQSCEGFMPALHGQVHVENPPPPPALTLALAVSQALLNKVTGAATVSGTVACNKAADVNLGITLTQRISRTEVVRGFNGQSLHCEAPGAALQIVVAASAGSFVKGRPVEIAANLSAFDPAYGTFVNVSTTQVVKLK
jgi:hypothetical protein